MNKRAIILGLCAFWVLVAFVIWNSVTTDPTQSGTDRTNFDPNAAPKEAIQRAWRSGDNSVFLQYTYTAPNACWQKSNINSLSIENDTATLTLVPMIVDAFCAQAMTALTYDQVIEITRKIEVLVVIVEHPAGGLIERSELWIEPEKE
ncbi:hypothetical protein [uncultured Maritalea sp.]|uniref:hypothetical protein n=1 Tax=uncultured Maritalea sp. TaxID=757249 RepID=UPI0026245FED|nr:hypothetical protein [uncultured Maritalea sp.]